MTDCKHKKIYGFHIVNKNIVNVLDVLSKVLEKYKLNVANIATSPLDVKGPNALFVAIDFTGSDASPNNVIEELSSADGVVDVKLVEPVFGGRYLYDYCCRSVVGLYDERIIMLGRANISGLLVGLRKRFGGDVISALYYDVWFEVGRKACELYVSPVDHASVDMLIELLNALFVSHGWISRMTLTSVGKGKIVLNVEGSFECEYLKDIVNESASHIFRGALGGFSQCTSSLL